MTYELRFSDKQVTAWGGLSFLKRMLEHMGFDRALQTAGLPPPGSNRGYAPEQLITQLMISVWCGANRFEHAEVTRHDPVIGKLFGFTRMANFKAVMRLFERFTPRHNETVFDHLYRWQFDSLALKTITLDLDSTVMTRYGHQQGAAKGYNPHKRGRLSHHPLMAFVAETDMVANCWLRPGDTSSANNAQGFLDNTLQRLGGKHVGLVRADSGFCDQAFLQHLEQRGLHYTVAMKLNAPLQNALINAGQDGQGWWPLLDDAGKEVAGIELTQLEYQAPSWDKPRWVTGVRQHIKTRQEAKGKTLSLFADDPSVNQWRYGAIVSDINLSGTNIWRLYRGRANCENRIKELKYDFGADAFNMKAFTATEAVLSTVMIAYNLMSLFKRVLVKATRNQNGQAQALNQTLKTLRYKLFAKPAYITKEGNKRFLNIVINMQQRQWIQGMWDTAHEFDLPIRFTPQSCG
jgi:hypothetical protein